ncbi:MAG TPA: DUF2283 domain-containing protein [Tepidisphaeraceae bacterium]|jgi:uncharacterized protein YuzE
MATNIKIWFDPEADFLEVLFSDKPGDQRQTGQDDVMERVDENGKLLGFSIMHVSQLAKDRNPLSAQLAEQET